MSGTSTLRRSSSSSTGVKLLNPPAYLPTKDPGSARPAHHADGNRTKFSNPWPSFRDVGTLELLKMFRDQSKASPLPAPDEIKRLIPVRTPTWGRDFKEAGGVKATWLGHACFLIEFPAPDGASRGLRVLTDPVLSNRCSPSQWAGPARYTPAPCTAEEIPDFDVLVLSHNHYDHLDLPTLRRIARRPTRPHIFLPLNTARILRGTGFEKADMTEMDWWEAAELAVNLEGAAEPTVLTITGTPAQHFTSRTPFDKGASLWNSFALSIKASVSSTSPSPSLFFAGDTGYSALQADANPRSPTPAEYLPDRAVCPAFKEIGEHFGGFDLALVPIGAYNPRGFMSAVHMDPFDAVQYFRDIRAKRAIAMHWGVWRLTTEPIDEPPRLLAEARKQFGVSEDEFHTLEIGETRTYA